MVQTLEATDATGQPVASPYPEMLHMRDIITELQSLGVRMPDPSGGRNGGAGPAEGRALIIAGKAVNVPISAPYVAHSPYHMAFEQDRCLLFKKDVCIAPVVPVAEPGFYRFFTEDNQSSRKIALLHGCDCLATTVLQRCVHWQQNRRCAFCGTQISLVNKSTLAVKTPAQLSEVARMAKTLDHVSHMVLTAGTGDPPGSEIAYLADCARAVKEASGLPVHVQFAPPKDLGLMDALTAAGVDTVGIHAESFDKEILARYAPAKAAIGMARYRAAWRRAVELFGPNQVSSFLIVGMGETAASVVWGSEMLADLGVYPYVVPLRPIPGSAMAGALPPRPETMKRIYTAVARILKRKGLSAAQSRAGCVRCGACSAMSAYESPVDSLICHSARTPAERDACLDIRHEVFVGEQKLFKDSDVDAHDRAATLLVAKRDGQTVGTVRIYPGEQGNGHWVGGRLAVKKGFRDFRVGALLVKEAMKRVKKRDCTLFTAHIQEKNVPFFRKIGWQPTKSLENYHGQPHQFMVADLDRVPNDL